MMTRRGHYIDSELPMEERERRLAKAKAESDKLKSWDDLPEVCEDDEFKETV